MQISTINSFAAVILGQARKSKGLLGSVVLSVTLLASAAVGAEESQGVAVVASTAASAIVGNSNSNVGGVSASNVAESTASSLDETLARVNVMLSSLAVGLDRHVESLAREVIEANTRALVSALLDSSSR
ncbi:MAG: hypothetical protein ACI93R_002195 [Flavobacteriales bacterium]|jgi:hypothetical protein